MRTLHHILVASLLASCAPVSSEDPLGGQSGSLRDDPLELPEDAETLDYDVAVTQALALVLGADLATPWRGHLELLAAGDAACPTVWLGAPDDMDMGDGTVTWSGGCSVDGLSFEGDLSWATTLDPETGGAQRDLFGEAEILRGGEAELAFDGEASDSVVWVDDAFSYTSSIDGQVSGLAIYGADASIPGGFRGRVDLTTGSDGTLTVDANLYLFGEPLLGRFDSVVADLEFLDDCDSEPVGYIGLRGTDGYWFDVYFLPRYAPDDPSVEAQAFPYEIIEDPVCDGCGHLFVRNVRVDAVPQVCPDFGSLAAALTAPAVDEYVLTLHDPPWETE